MKVFVNYPVMITPGVYRYDTQELDMTVDQVPYATEDLEHEIVIDHDGLFICVKSDEAVEKLTMMRKDDLALMAQIRQELLQGAIDAWCLAHDIDSKYVLYENGRLCIPVTF